MSNARDTDALRPTDGLLADGSLLAAGDRALAASDRLADARATVESAVVAPDAERWRAEILAFLDDHPDALHRSCTQGHLTGSAVVFDHTGDHVVLLEHRKLRRWLQPGGHCDGNANLAAVALREATEETGMAGLAVRPGPVDLDVHEVDHASDGPHLHLDVRFLVLAPPDADLTGNHESTAIEWVPVEAVSDYGIDEGTVRMIAAARRVLGR